MTNHNLKTIEPFFSDTWFGNKTFEIRLNDRDFKKGDILFLMRHNTLPKKSIACRVKYIMDDPEYVKEGYIVMGIEIS